MGRVAMARARRGMTVQAVPTRWRTLQLQCESGRLPYRGTRRRRLRTRDPVSGRCAFIVQMGFQSDWRSSSALPETGVACETYAAGRDGDSMGARMVIRCRPDRRRDLVETNNLEA